MKRIVRFLVLLMIVLNLSGCQGNFEEIDFKEAIELSEDGIVKEDVLTQLKNEHAIANFVGACSEYQYEWLIFGSDVSDTKAVNLALSIENKGETEIGIRFAQEQAFDFPMFLSITLNEKWDAQNATLYCGEESVGEVSITGSKTSILNLNVSSLQGEYVIRAENPNVSETEVLEELEIVASSVEQAEESVETDTKKENIQADAGSYLAQVEDISGKVYLSDAKGGTGVVFAPSKQDEASQSNVQAPEKDTYLSDAKSSGTRVYSSGTGTKKDKYETDPIPAGKPMPVEPENQEINKAITHTCTFSIECSTILNNLGDLDSDKRELVPSNGVIMPPTEVTFYEGESVYDVLIRVCKEKGIHMEASWTPIYNSAYVEGIHNLYEFDCGELSGWMYRVNGWYPNYGCSRYQLVAGEVVEWRFTCDLGRDVGCNWMG